MQRHPTPQYEMQSTPGLVTIEQGLPVGPVRNALLGLQISSDGRVWIYLNGQSLLRFVPQRGPHEPKMQT